MAEDNTLHTFTASGAKRIVAATRRVEGVPQSDARGRANLVLPIPPDKFLAKITGNASLATSRFKYAWTEVLLTGNGVTTRVGGRSGTTTTDYAINLLEMDNDGSYAAGVALGGADYPVGFGVRPIGGGGTDATHRTDVIVEMTQLHDSAGAKKYIFSAQNSHDGTCT